MKKILVPTDFTERGDYAYNIASKIAKSTNAEIITLYVLPGRSGAYYTTDGSQLKDEGGDFTEWQNRLAQKKSKMVAWIDGKSDVSDSICTIGEIDKTILQIIEQKEIDLVVMGTEGHFNKSSWSKGSHTEYITNHAQVPVLSLKSDRSNLDLGEIVFVSDFLENKIFDLTMIKRIQEVFQSKIALLKIKTPTSKRDHTQVLEDMEEFAGLNKIHNYSVNVFEDSSVETGIGKFCAERDIDLIVLGTHQSKGFSRLFQHGVSDDIVNHLFHPILTFPIK